MNRTLASFLATAISLAGFVALFAAVSWFMHAVSFGGHPHFGLIVASTTALLYSVVLVPFVVFGLQRKKSAEQIDQSGAPKPAPRLWLRSFQRSDE
jgi:hypothetical protein